MLCDSEYNVFDLIVFIERNMVQVSLSDRMKHAKVNGEGVIGHFIHHYTCCIDYQEH